MEAGRLGRNLRHLVNTIYDLTTRGVEVKVLTGQGAAIDTTTAAGKLVFGIFASLAEFEESLLPNALVRVWLQRALVAAKGAVGPR